MEETPCRIPATEDEKDSSGSFCFKYYKSATPKKQKGKNQNEEEQRAMALTFTTAAGRLLTTKVGLDDIVTT